jgi:hypothetical protein
MEDNRREYPRYSVNLYVESREGSNEPPHVLNLSEGGFLVRGEICAGHGGVFHASFRVHPSTGETRVSTKGRVVRSSLHEGEYEYGIKIDAFGSPAEEAAYMTYVRELAASGPSSNMAMSLPN